MTTKSIVKIVFAIGLIPMAYADSPFPTGGNVFSLPNQTDQSSPDIKTDRVSIFVEGAQLPKESGLWSGDTDLGFSFKVTVTYQVEGANTTTTTPQAVVVSKAYSFDVTRDDDGNVQLPLKSIAVVDTCPLLEKNLNGAQAYISDLNVDITLMETKDVSGFSNVLQQVFKLTSKLPIPNPYTQYLSVLGDGISDLTQSAIDQDSKPQSFSSIAFHFQPKDADLSGYSVLLMSTDQPPGNGFVDIKALEKSKLGFDPVQGLTYNGQSCLNAYIVFRVVYTPDPLIGSINPQSAISIIQKQGKLAVKNAALRNIQVPVLSSLGDKLQTFTEGTKPPEAQVLQKALSELNSVKLAPINNSFKGIPAQSPKY